MLNTRNKALLHWSIGSVNSGTAAKHDHYWCGVVVCLHVFIKVLPFES